MVEKVEWEVVDSPAPPPGGRPSPVDLMKSLLGPWWKWKIVGAVTLAGLALIFFTMVAGVFILLVAAGAIVSIGISKLRRWWHSAHRS